MTDRHQQLIRHMDQAVTTTDLTDYDAMVDHLSWRYSFAGKKYFWQRRQKMKGPKTQLRRGLWLGLPIGAAISYFFWLIVWGW